MTRVKRGVTKRRRHKEILAQAKGHQNSRRRQYKWAKESLLHAWAHTYFHRRERKGDFRRLWILRIGAAARQLGMTYSQFMYGLKKAQVALDRKMLADMAVRDAKGFEALIGVARQHLTA